MIYIAIISDFVLLVNIFTNFSEKYPCEDSINSVFRLDFTDEKQLFRRMSGKAVNRSGKIKGFVPCFDDG